MTTALPTPGEQSTFQALGQAMEELRAAQESQAEPVRVWRLTREVLNLMHSLDDQLHKRLGPDYREVTRRATEDGRTQAALTLVRGIAHHHGSEVQALVWRGMELLAVEKDRLVPMKVLFVEAEGSVEAQTFTMAATWRPLSELPDSTEKQQLHDRDIYYARHVEGRGLMEPLLAAQRFLQGLQQL